MTVQLKILQAAIERLTPVERRAILAPYTAAREGMRNSETPGHRFWYAEHLADEREAATLLGFPPPSPGYAPRSIEIDTGPYMRSHGKAPRGRGGWAFAPNGNDDVDALIWTQGTYGDAVRAAKVLAPEGTVVLAVQP